jgi:PhoD-like phosphatase
MIWVWDDHETVDGAWMRMADPSNHGDDEGETVDSYPARAGAALAAAREWLADQLATSTARWRILGNQVVLNHLKVLGAPSATGLSRYANPDQWDGYPHARDRLFDMLEATSDVVVLTGDVHAGLAFEVTRDPNDPTVYGSERLPGPRCHRRAGGGGVLVRPDRHCTDVGAGAAPHVHRPPRRPPDPRGPGRGGRCPHPFDPRGLAPRSSRVPERPAGEIPVTTASSQATLRE